MAAPIGHPYSVRPIPETNGDLETIDGVHESLAPVNFRPHQGHVRYAHPWHERQMDPDEDDDENEEEEEDYEMNDVDSYEDRMHGIYPREAFNAPLGRHHRRHQIEGDADAVHPTLAATHPAVVAAADAAATAAATHPAHAAATHPSVLAAAHAAAAATHPTLAATHPVVLATAHAAATHPAVLAAAHEAAADAHPASAKAAKKKKVAKTAHPKEGEEEEGEDGKMTTTRKVVYGVIGVGVLGAVYLLYRCRGNVHCFWKSLTSTTNQAVKQVHEVGNHVLDV
jgi:pyruvate/2-oxoglutarate dehydrogenase complex dihydrolipoamide acyltransferase (E2) component